MHFGRYVIQSKTKPLNRFHLLHLALARYNFHLNLVAFKLIEYTHYDKKLTKNIRPTDILKIYIKF